MNFFKDFRSEIIKKLEDMATEGDLPSGLDFARVAVEPPKDAAFGDVTTNAAMVLAKDAGKPPRAIAEALARRLQADDDVARVVVAGPGFLNVTFETPFWFGRLRDVLDEGVAYGNSDLGGGRLVNVEYVSANPTGPMHVGHARGAVVGDVLASLLAKAGFNVTREYYINDAGAQVEALARSAHLRYREALGETIGDIPEGLYPGEYLKDVGQTLAKRDGARWKDKPESEWIAPVRDFAIAAMMELIKVDLAALGVHHAVFSSERELHAKGEVKEAVDELARRQLVYRGTLEPPKGKLPDDWEPREQLLFRSTQFGDDVDRPLQKSDGSWTYFAGDIAYHYDKYRRGFLSQIDVWGADHGGYVKRMKAAVKALSDGKADLDVKLCQLVNLLDNGEPVKMSKRSGTFVTLRDVVDRVGKDVVRFIMLTRKNDATLDFDFARVLEQSKENPVFYVQYAHARAHSVFRNAREEFADLDSSAAALTSAPVERLTGEGEVALIKLMAAWPRLVEGAADAHEPHRVAFFLYDLAAAFHGLWNRGNTDPSARFIVRGDRELTAARLALVRATATVIASGLAVLGVTPVEEMR
ncbi:MAG TPA: arginine--tRNA ligase [Alphaproteobacteria bacterium]|nr:arginine--tRNA ligase [Alphaproteobacteria bacterium]